jgi:AmmeMemoRadiSam system protein A
MTTLTDPQREVLLDVAASAVHDALLSGRGELPDDGAFEPLLREPGATFVTLERDAELLGCIGTLEPVRGLALDVAHNALAAAFADPRLPAVTRDDYAEMSIKVSVLSRPEPVAVSSYEDVLAAVRPGVDGLLLEAGPYRSTLLPSVWPKIASAEEFLFVLWRKAGLRAGAWLPGTRVSRYTTEEFGDPGPRAPLPVPSTGRRRFA